MLAVGVSVLGLLSVLAAVAAVSLGTRSRTRSMARAAVGVSLLWAVHPALIASGVGFGPEATAAFGASLLLACLALWHVSRVAGRGLLWTGLAWAAVTAALAATWLFGGIVLAAAVLLGLLIYLLPVPPWRAALPVLLALAGWGIGKLLRPHPVKGTASWRGLLLLAAIGVWSHPLLDLLNVYGIRLLMPFSGHWFKADALFIIDPWMWLVLLGGLVLGRVRASPRPSRGALGVFAGYALVMAVLGRIGPGIVAGQTGVEARTMAAPGPLNPLRRQVLRDLGPEYESGELRFGFPPAYRSGNRIPAGRNDPGAREAAASPDGRWFLRWARFPVFVSEPVHGGLRVTIQDLRFGRSIRNGSWASISVLVPRPGSGAPAP